MSAVIKFPETVKLDPNRFHRQRLFYIGKVLHEPSYFCNYQEYYLRRNKVVRGNKRWSLKILGLRKKTDLEPCMFAISSCDDDQLLEMLEKWNLLYQISYKKLFWLGWRGKLKNSAKILNFKLSK